MSRTDKMNEFLNSLLSRIRENVDLDFNDTAILYLLTHYGVSDVEAREEISIFYDEWKVYYEKSNSVNVKEDETNNKIFFSSKEYSFPKDNCVQIFVPFHIYKIKNDIEILIDALKTNRIPFTCEIESRYKNDSVVINTTSLRHAKFITSYINENFKNHTLEGNPFLPNNDEISFTISNELSYLEVLSKYIYMYMNDIKYEEKIKSVDINHFSNYLKEKSDEYFFKVNNIDSFEKVMGFNNNKTVEKCSIMADCFKQTKLIFMSLMDAPLSEYNKTMWEYNDPQTKSKLRNYFYSKYTNTEFKSVAQSKKEYEDYVSGLLSSITEYFIGAYGFQVAVKNLNDLILYDKYAVLPNLYDFRSKAKSVPISSFVQEIKHCCNERMDIVKYVQNISLKKLEKQKQTLFDASYSTYGKYEDVTEQGKFQLYNAIVNLINGNYNGFTNDNNVRNALASSIKPSELNTVIMNSLDRNVDLSEKNIYQSYVEQIAEQYNNMIVKESSSLKK